MRKPDFAERYTDKDFAEYEKRIRKVYEQAEKEIGEKLADFTERHKARDIKMRKLVEAGKMTEADYKSWMQGQVFQGKQWKAKQQQMAETLYNANTIAQRMANGNLPKVFAMNANYMSYTAEKAAGYRIGFTMYDSATVANLIKNDPKILPFKKLNKEKDIRWNFKNIKGEVTQGIIQGESVDEIAARLQKEMPNRSYKMCRVHARTMYTSAQNAGRMESMKMHQQMGIKNKKQWMATLDERTRWMHRDLDGQVRELEEPFEIGQYSIMYPGDPFAHPSMTYNCVVGNTNIACNSEIIRSYCHVYTGELVKIKTAGGVNLTCTPNHPILTRRGWVSAALLNKTDDLVVASLRNAFGVRRYGDINHIHSRMKALYNALHNIGLMGRDSTLSVNFHGDIPTTNVEVITKKWLLWLDGKIRKPQGLNKTVFKVSDKPLFGKRTFMKHFCGVWSSTLCNIGGFRKALSLFGRRLLHPFIHGFGTVSDWNACGTKTVIDDVSTDTEFLGKSLGRLPGDVFLDNIVDIDFCSDTCHVYNLQTGNNIYFVNEIINDKGKKDNGIYAISHNCRCTMDEVVDKYPDTYERRDNITKEVIQNMTYNEWAEMNGISNPRPDGMKPVMPEKQKEPLSATDALIGRAKVYAAALLSTLPTAEAAEFEKMLDEGDEDMRELYSRYTPECRKIFRSASGGAYNPGFDSVEYSFSNYEGQSKYSTMAHEMGHMFDNHIKKNGAFTFKEMDLINERCVFGSGMYKTVRERTSSSDQFLAAMRADRDNLREMLKDETFLNDVRRSNGSAGLQDALDGLFGTRGKNHIRGLNWGHGDKYYNRFYNNNIKGFGLEKELKGVYKELGFDASNQDKVRLISRDYDTASELWANVSSATMCGGTEKEYFDKYMPNTMATFKEMIRKVNGRG